MTDEVFNVMKCFPNSYLNPYGELILSDKGNVFFNIKSCVTKQDIVCKLLEWCSRPIAKGEPYRPLPLARTFVFPEGVIVK